MAKLTLDNFEQYTPSAILQRGRAYFNNNCITELNEWGNGRWSAEVEGSDVYTVQVQLQGKQISEYECDCPYDGDPCKHTVSIWYALRNRLAEETKTGSPKKKKKSGFKSLLKEISLEELQGFLKDYISRNADFRSDFELYFADKGGVDIESRYSEMIRKIIKKHTTRGFIDYRASSRLASDVKKIVGSGKDYANKKNYRDVFLLIKAILLPLTESMNSLDDSNGDIDDIIYDVIQLLADLVTAPGTPRPLLADIFEYLLNELTNHEYFRNGDFGWELFATMQNAALKLDEADRFLNFIDQKLAVLTGEHDQHDLSELIHAKIYVLEQVGRLDEAEAIEQRYLYIFNIRQGVVDDCISRGNYGKAKALIAEGIRIAEEQRFPGHVSSFEQDLLEIAGLEKDIDTVRRLCKKFAFDRFGLSTDHYRRWKATYSKTEWIEVIEAHIRQVIDETTKTWKKEKGFWRPKQPPLLEALAPIYIEERFIDRLFELVKKESNLTTLFRYHDYLKKQYAADLAVIYAPLLEAYGHQTTSRTEYADLVSKMKFIIKDIPTARAEIRAVAQRLKDVYSVKPRRPAMLEELSTIV